MNQALDADEAGLRDIAVRLYTDAAELGLSTVSMIRFVVNYDILLCNWFLWYVIYAMLHRKLTMQI